MGAIVAAITAFFVMLNDGVTFIKSIFGKSSSDNSEDAATKAVAMSNESGKVAADVARTTDDQLNKELKDASAENAAVVNRVRNAGSVRAQQSAVDDAIARANKDPDSDR